MTPLDEIAWKRARLAAWLERHALDMVLLTQRANFAWLTAGGTNHVVQGAEGGVTTLVATRDAIRCVANAIEAPRMRTEELVDLDIDVIEHPWHDAQAEASVWHDVVGSRRAAADVRLPAMPPSVSALPADFAELRWELCEAEMRRYRTLGADVGAALGEVARAVKPGETEFEVAAAMAARLNGHGIRLPVVLIASDERIDRYRHPVPTDRQIGRRVMLVACGERHGLIASATRLVSFGPLSDDSRRRHDAVVRVDAAFIANTRPGRTLSEVFRAGCEAYAAVGFPDEWRLHHQGGSAGYLGREVKATPDATAQVLPHQAFAWNPSIAGTKSEDTILVMPERIEILTQAKDWPMIEVDAGGRTWRRCDILVVK